LDLLFSVDMNRERQADQLIGIREQSQVARCRLFDDILWSFL